jgi:hypothetical protein
MILTSREYFRVTIKLGLHGSIAGGVLGSALRHGHSSKSACRGSSVGEIGHSRDRGIG